MPQISIIIPVYNLEKYIKRCLDSVINQTFKDLEIIVVDDGSKDTSPEICDAYAKLDSRIKVIHKVNGGLSSARNSGLLEARGKYIMTLDGDDYVDENLCQLLYNSIIEKGADMSMCSIKNVTEEGESVSYLDDDSPLKEGVMTSDEYREALLKKGNWYYVVAWNKLYKRQCFKDVLYPEGKIHEDEYVIHRIINNCEKISVITDRLYNYVVRKGSITNSNYSPKRLDVLYSLFDRSFFYMENNAKDSVISSNTVIAVKTLYNTYSKADMKNEEFKKKYKEIHKELKVLIKKTLKYKMRISYRVFLISNLVSPKISYRIFDKKRAK